MNIKLVLTIRFAALMALLLAIFSIIVYEVNALYRINVFYERVQEKAIALTHDYANKLTDFVAQDSIPFKPQSTNIYSLSVFNDADKLISDSILKVSDELALKRFEISTNKNYQHFYQDTATVGFTIQYKNKGYKIIAQSVDLYGKEKLLFLKKVILLSLLIGTLLTLILGWFFAKEALTSINKIITEVDQITASNLDKRLPINKTVDEVDKLKLTFNHMLNRIEASFKMQKNFVANASHEFRTPLTAMKAQIEVILMQNRTDKEYQLALKSLEEDIDEFLMLVQSLSELAKVDSPELKVNAEKISLIELIAETRSALLRSKSNYQIQLNFANLPETEEENYVSGNATLLQAAFKNLIENACKFSPAKKCDVEVFFNPSHILIIITDEGIGIAAEELPHIFEPFYRANDTRGIAGHGIGLSLVKRIIDLHVGKITVESNQGQGTKFSITLPSCQA